MLNYHYFVLTEVLHKGYKLEVWHYCIYQEGFGMKHFIKLSVLTAVLFVIC